MLLRNITGVHSVGIDELLYVEADGDTTRVFCTTQENPIIVSTHLKDFLEKLAPLSKDLIRVNRSNAVNIRKILQIKDEPMNLSGRKLLILKQTDEKLVLSLKYKKDLMVRFKLI